MSDDWDNPRPPLPQLHPKVSSTVLALAALADEVQLLERSIAVRDNVIATIIVNLQRNAGQDIGPEILRWYEDEAKPAIDALKLKEAA